jgi:SAM-dependent methyltransferase
VSVPFGSDADRSGPGIAPSATQNASASQTIDPIELYAAGIDSSDYVARVAPLIRQRLGQTGDLLDVGAGGGQLGHALRASNRRWTAIEPSARMRARLARFEAPPFIIASGWDAADVRTGTDAPQP